METQIFIKNGVIIVGILAAVFLSQQEYVQTTGKEFIVKNTQKQQEYLVEAQAWVKTNLWPRIDGEVNKAQLSATEGIVQQKNNFLQNIWKSSKNYFAEKFSTTFGTKVE